METPIPEATLKALAACDTCAIANAIECFDVRLRNEGFSNSGTRCNFPQLPPMAGYAVTLRVRSGNPPAEGGTYLDRTEWWDQLDLQPVPHVVVIEDTDETPGVGAFVGEIHSAILQALGCVGVVTNGAVRDLGAVERTGFHLFSKDVSVSHAYMHVVGVNVPVNVAGMCIEPGDLLHGDRHGVIRIPSEIAPKLPETIARIQSREREILDFCKSGKFSKADLRRMLSKPC
ncbi:MAG: RraA family protein [Chthoniobacteraceae bacterium]